MQRIVNGPMVGRSLIVPVCVDWPELRLTEEQMLANAVAIANGQPPPFPDPSIFDIELPYVPDCNCFKSA